MKLVAAGARLFAADSYLTWFENGFTNVDWWKQHSGPGTPSVINGAQDYGDGGLFSSGTNASGVTEPPLNTPFAPYYGFVMLSKLGAPGDTMVNVTSGDAVGGCPAKHAALQTFDPEPHGLPASDDHFPPKRRPARHRRGTHPAT
jgi:hypothetical protein